MNSKITEKNFYAEKACIICGSTDLIKKSALFVPFLTKRMFNSKEKKTKLYTCKHCGFSYSSYRPTDIEMNRYYQNYMQPEYIKDRDNSENGFLKWREDYINSDILKNEINFRQDFAGSIIKKYISPDKIKNLLDYGGSKGEFIPKEFNNSQKFVYDIDETIPIPKITKINKENIKNYKWDLILLEHVLEHVSYPMNIINEINNIATKGTFLYIEVPYEDFFEKKLHKLSIKKIIKNPRYILEQTGLLNTNIQIHEHINFFRVNTFINLFKKSDYKILECNFKNTKHGFGQNAIIYCLLEKIK